MKLKTERSRTDRESPRSATGMPEADLVLRIYELLQGERDMVKIYSKQLRCEIYLVNPALKDPQELRVPVPVYTTHELAFVLALSGEELKRFHYLKKKLLE